jgi:hypothetical protein
MGHRILRDVCTTGSAYIDVFPIGPSEDFYELCFIDIAFVPGLIEEYMTVLMKQSIDSLFSGYVRMEHDISIVLPEQEPPSMYVVTVPVIGTASTPVIDGGFADCLRYAV